MVAFNSILSLAVCLGAVKTLALWPLPSNTSTGSDILYLSDTFFIQNDVPGSPQDLWDAIGRAASNIWSDSLSPLVPDFGASLTANLTTQPASLEKLVLSLYAGAEANTIMSEAIKAYDDRDEGYYLNVPSNGTEAVLTANTTLGLLRGLATFTQIWYKTPDSEQKFAFEAPFDISDAPAFPWRGFLLDTSRNFFPVADIYRTLDAMEMVKLNQFHWHVTDSQSWPIYVESHPELMEAAAYSPSMTYSKSDVASVVAYAGARGIDVLVEVDTPGHTDTIALSHPDLVACHELPGWANWANEPPPGQLRFMLPESVELISSVFTSMADMFPSKYFSTGGDELNELCYTNDTISSTYLANNNITLYEALGNFTNATHGALKLKGKTPVVWEEMLITYPNVTLSPETLIIVWVSSEDALAVANLGYDFIHAGSNNFYLDCGAGEWIGTESGGQSWCTFNPWQRIYSFDPYQNLTSSQYSYVKGGETALWTEQSSPENLDSIVWPRAAAAAELWWTGSPTYSYPLNSSLALPRLHDVRYRMVERGIKAIALQPLWCVLRPDLCNLDS